jgi:tRNA-2-methylthio-N6-dimethylallyladenosine synthase
MKKLHIKTYGCQMNVYDSSRMADLLLPLGYEETAQAEEADMVILNTCHIREKAAEKVYSELGRLRAGKEEWARTGKRKLIAVAGCVAQAEGAEIVSRAPYVDIVVGSQSYQHLPQMIEQTLRESAAAIHLEFPEHSKFDALPETLQPSGLSAFVSIQEGCDKFCSFCVVPYTRGAEFSRPVAAIEAEIRTRLEQGSIEIVLLGQNVNAYHGVGADGDEWNLARLIRHISTFDGIKRIRYTTSHPKDMDDDLIAAHGEIETLMSFLHLPVQSGANRILKAMNRKHTAEDYLAIIEKLRSARPDMAFSSDFIVGFPGETEAEFEATIRLVEMVEFSQAYSFMYSPRPGTPAAERADSVADDVKYTRLQGLQSLLQRQQLRFNQRMIGEVMPVLFDREGRREGQAIGKTPYMQSVYIDKPVEYRHGMIDVRITGAYPQSMSGEVILTSAYSAAHEGDSQSYGKTAHG